MSTAAAQGCRTLIGGWKDGTLGTHVAQHWERSSHRSRQTGVVSPSPFTPRLSRVLRVRVVGYARVLVFVDWGGFVGWLRLCLCVCLPLRPRFVGLSERTRGAHVRTPSARIWTAHQQERHHTEKHTHTHTHSALDTMAEVPANTASAAGAPSLPPKNPRETERVRSTRDSIADVNGPRTPYQGVGSWPERVDSSVREGEEVAQWVPSACVLCSNGCACDIGVSADGRMVGVRGRGSDRVNRGRLGPKGLHCFDVNEHRERLTHPLIRGADGKLHQATWDEAMTLIVQRAEQLRAQATSHSIAFYTSGQLFLEEYYVLAMVGKAGLHTLHMDGNTRLCTATAAAAMRESFGTDGQPGSYEDIDCTDCIFLVGHNMANSQTVLWARVLDRLAGPNPPTLIVLDPRVSESAKHATVHLANRAGTNLAVLNGLARLLIEGGYVKEEWVEQHTVGYDGLKKSWRSTRRNTWSRSAAYPPPSCVRLAAFWARRRPC